MNTTEFEILNEENVSDHYFDVIVNRAPAEKADLGFFSRRDGEILVQIRIPDMEDKKKKRKSKQFKYKSKNDNTDQFSIMEIKVNQSMSLLNSNSLASTTGAMLWKVSALFVEWFLKNISVPSGLINIERFDVIEVGCGGTALLSIALGCHAKINHYIATDQPHIIKLAQKNIQNHFEEEVGTCVPENIKVVKYDWEDADVDIKNVLDALPVVESTDDIFILACDVVYNDFLICYLLDAIEKLSESYMNRNINILIALQVRDSSVIENFLHQIVERPAFNVWYIPDSLLTQGLTQGFTVYYARYLKQ